MQRIIGINNGGFLTDRGSRLIVDDDDNDGTLTDVPYDDDRCVCVFVLMWSYML
jgi:hypothetical protein